MKYSHKIFIGSEIIKQNGDSVIIQEIDEDMIYYTINEYEIEGQATLDIFLSEVLKEKPSSIFEKRGK